MYRLGLRARLALVFAGGFAFLLSLGGAALESHLRDTYRADFDSTLVDAGRGAVSLWAEDRPEYTLADSAVAHVVGELRFGDQTLLAFDSTGRRLAISLRFPGSPLFDDLVSGGRPWEPFTVRLREGRARTLRVPLGEGIDVYVAMATRSLEFRLAQLRLSLLIGLPLILVAGALFGAWAAQVVLRPIVDVARSAEATAHQVGAGATRFEALPPRPGDDEITSLTQAFNLLLAKLSDALLRERSAADRQRRFLADAAHELRTPVAILRSEAEVALAGPADADSYRHSLERVAQEADALAGLVNDLLLMARGDAHAPPVERQRLYLDDLVNRSLSRLRTHPMARGRELRRGAFEAAPVTGDAELLERAVLVLLHNALVHAPGSPVEVSTGSQADGEGREWSWVTVRDWGPGVPADARERIFERFARLDVNAPGTGLGLAIAKWISQLHGGRLTLSDAPGGGAAFTLECPAADGTGGEAAEGSS